MSKGTYRACIHVSCVYVFLLFPALSAEKLGKTSSHCQVLHGNNQKSRVSPVWRRKCCIRNLEWFCGRALSNCRNKSLATYPNPWSLFMEKEEVEIVPAPLLAWVEPGQGEHRYSIQCGASWGCYCALLFLSPTWCDKGSSSWQSQCHFWVVRGKSAISWQDGSVITPEEMGRK